MPFTPYHFGPSAFIALALKKYFDIPVFVLANLIVDIEVLLINLLGLGPPIHRYSHTLLIGAVAGIIWGLAAYPFRNLFKKVMQILRIPYETGLRKMAISGVFGVWLHAITDGIYHWDVQMFWPSKARPLRHLASEGQVKTTVWPSLLQPSSCMRLLLLRIPNKKRPESKSRYKLIPDSLTWFDIS